MNRNGLKLIVVLIFMLAMILSCEKIQETNYDGEHEDPADYTWDTTEVVKELNTTASDISILSSKVRMPVYECRYVRPLQTHIRILTKQTTLNLFTRASSQKN